MKRLLLALILLVLPITARAQSGFGTVQGTANLTIQSNGGGPGLGWTDVPGSAQINLCPNIDSVHQCASTVLTWSGGAADTTNNILYWTGGGHNDSPDNSVYEFNANTGVTSVAHQPYTPYESLNYCQDANPDGQPAAEHTYGGLVFMPTPTPKVIMMGGIPWCTTGNQSNAIWTMDVTTHNWTRIDGTMTCTNCGGVFSEGRFDGAAWDPISKTVYAAGHVKGIWNYNPSTNVMNCFDCNGNDVGTDYQSGVVDPVRRLFFLIGNNSVKRMNISSPPSNQTFSTDTFNSNCSAAVNTSAPGAQYDPNTGLITIWSGDGGTVYFYNPDTMSCTSTAFSNPPPASSQNGMWGRFAYLPNLGEYVEVNNYANDVYILVTDTSSGGSNADSDFAARCATPGVIKCQGFDTSAAVSGHLDPDATGNNPPTIDTTNFASGGGSLHMIVPSLSSANTSGDYWTDFSDSHTIQFDSLINGDPASLTNACGGSPCGNEFYIQWRQMFDNNMGQQFAGSEGWKQAIIGEGDASHTAYSCTDMEIVAQNTNLEELPQLYHSCGVKLGTYDALETLLTPSGWSVQNVAGGYLACHQGGGQPPVAPPCIPYVANQWMTFQLHVKVGTWYPGGGSASNPPATYKHDSTIQYWVATEGQPSVLVIDYHPGATSSACDNTQQDIPNCQTGYDLANPSSYPVPNGSPSSYGNVHAKYGKIWLLPYQTDKDGTVSQTQANVWYDELIISTQKIPDPKY